MNATMSADKRALLEKGSVGTLFLKYAIPSLVTVMFFGFQSLVDGVLVGNYLGPDALGGVNIILPLFSFIIVLALVLGVGSQTLVSLGLGENNEKKSQDAMTTGFWATIAVSLVASLVLLFFDAPLVRLLGADERLLPYALGYLEGLMPFVLLITLCFYSDAMLKSMGYPKLSMLIMSSVVVLNIVLSLYFVAVLEWGTFGAGIATGIAFALGFFVTGVITFDPRRRLSMLKGRFDVSLLGHAFYNGSSEGMSELAAAVSILVINLTVINMLGAEGVAAFTAINYISFMGILLFLGISNGLIPVLSYNYGARSYGRVKQLFWFVAVVNTAIGVVVFIILQCYGAPVIQLFFDQSSASGVATLEIAVKGMAIVSFVFLMNGLNILIISFFTALGDARSSIVVSVLRGAVFLVAGVVFLPKFFGVNGVWMAIPVAELLSLCVALALFYNTTKKRLQE